MTDQDKLNHRQRVLIEMLNSRPPLNQSKQNKLIDKIRWIERIKKELK